MISVVIPACNEEKYILDTVNSVPAHCEVIVVCNGCTDKTYSLVKGKVDKVLNFKWRNIAKARNEGVKVSTKDVLVFLDADTCLVPGAVEDVVNNVKPNVVGTFKFKPSNDKFKHRMFYFLKNNLLCPFGVSNGVIFCDRQTYDSINGFDESVNKREDGMFVRTIKSKGSFVLLNRKVVNSTRRFDSHGYLGVVKYWIKEALKPSKSEYEVVR